MKIKKLAAVLLLASSMIVTSCGNKEVKETQAVTETTVAQEITSETSASPSPAPSNTSNAGETVTEDEAKRKEELGEFYVPLPAEKKEAKFIEARGVYLPPDTAGSPFDEENIERYKQYIDELKAGNNPDKEELSYINSLERSLALAQTTDINTLVMDVKTDSGTVVWESDIPAIKRLDAEYPFRSDNYVSLINYMKSHNIHSVARIVVFKDTNMSHEDPSHAMKLKDGELFYDYAENSWLNPFDETVWKYNVAVSQEAALRGFDEIHFDYVRFPENAADYNDKIDLPGRDGRPKDEAIAGFLKYAEKELKPYGVVTGAAIFGTTTMSWEDKPEDIGQTWRKITDKVDRVSPMIYPSHYSAGWFNIPVPDAEPYKFLEGSTFASIEKNAAVKHPAAYTPWIQGFTADWVEGHIEYTPEVIGKQIEAINSFGLNSYFVWNAAGNYPPETYITGMFPSRIEPGMDGLGRTKSEAVKRFFEGLKDEDFINTYIMTPIDERPEDYAVYKENFLKNGFKVTGYTIPEASDDEIQNVNLTFERNGEVSEADMEVRVIEESGIYKIQVSPEFLNLNNPPEGVTPLTTASEQEPEVKPESDEATETTTSDSGEETATEETPEEDAGAAE